jgi:hypothetical protein
MMESAPMNTTTNPQVSTTNSGNRAGLSSLAGPALVFLGLALVAVAIVVEPRLNSSLNKWPTGRYMPTERGMLDTKSGDLFKAEVKGERIEWVPAVQLPLWWY